VLVVLWFGCHCCPSVNTICGRIMIGLSLSSVSKHNMWSYYDWVVVVVRQETQYVVVLWLGCYCHPWWQWQPNHNTTTYCVFWRTKTTINPVIIRPHIVFTDVFVLWLNCRCCLLSVSTICGGIMIELLLLSSVSKHNMWAYYDWDVVVVVRQ
jgi:hypothetical protein